MSRAIVIQLDSQAIQAVVARNEGDGLKVDAVVSTPVVGGDFTAAEKQFAALLEEHHPHKAKILVAVPSTSIQWQYLSLPPCPPEDLPALVRMQLDLEGSREEEPLGYDFLPFAGSKNHPQRVLAMVLKVAELARVRNFYRVSGLKVQSIVPAAVGWIALGDALEGNQSSIAVFVALHNSEATIWTVTSDGLALLRQVQLVGDLNTDEAAASVSGQLQRTLLNLAQEGISTDDAQLFLVGYSPETLERLAESLRKQFSQNVNVLAIPPHLTAGNEVGTGKLLPLSGLAWEAIKDGKPHLDFLHPRKPPEPQSKRRTYVLAATAAGLLAAMVGWRLYANLNEPLWQTEILSDELYEVNQEIKPLEAEERDAARIRDWLAESPNVLTELANVAKAWRPEPTDSPKFSLPNDGVLKRVDINQRKLVLAGNVAGSSAVQSLENRLRDENHRVRRERSEPDAEGGKYPWQVQIVVEVVDGPPTDNVAEATP